MKMLIASSSSRRRSRPLSLVLQQSLKIMTLMLLMVFLLDTGQCQDTGTTTTTVQDPDCRSISDGCSCSNSSDLPRLRCMGKKEDLETLMDNLHKMNYQINNHTISLLDLTLTNLYRIDKSIWKQSSTINLRALVISSSQIESIQSSALTPLKKSLKLLSLTDNLLKSVPEDILQMEHLESLDLSKNQISSLETSDLFPPGLDTLDLSQNNISNLNSVDLPQGLKHLNLNQNKIISLGIRHFDLKNLIELHLSHNLLNGSLSRNTFFNVVLDSADDKNSNLEILDLSFNNFEKIESQALVKFSKLKTLKLKHNKIEVIHPLGFQGLNGLQKLELSNNEILDLPNALFKNLSTLDTLDLSYNHLQSINKSFTQGLYQLSTLYLANNDILFLEPLQDISEHLFHLDLEHNDLECVCSSLKPFWKWLSTCHNLRYESKKTIVCATPTKFANAMLTTLDISNCDEDDTVKDIPSTDNEPLVENSEEFQLLSQQQNGDDLTLQWRLESSWKDQISYCDLELYKSDSYLEVAKDINWSRSIFTTMPLDCQSENKTVIEAHLNLKQIIGKYNIHPAVTSILACAAIQKNDRLLENCTKVPLNSTKDPVTTEAYILNLEAKSEAIGHVEVHYEVNQQSDCQITFEIKARDPHDLGQRVVKSHKKSCKGQNFTFQGLRIDPLLTNLQVCASLDLQHQSSSIQKRTSKCTSVKTTIPLKSKTYQERPTNITHKAPILALVLTLVFLGIGIAALVVLYLIVKGYLSDRHKAELFHMRFCHMNNNNNVQSNPRPASLWMRWTHRFFLWRHYHVHRPVPASDEMVLREDSTFDTSVV